MDEPIRGWQERKVLRDDGVLLKKRRRSLGETVLLKERCRDGG
jgi:hypothetical protein